VGSDGGAECDAVVTSSDQSVSTVDLDASTPSARPQTAAAVEVNVSSGLQAYVPLPAHLHCDHISPYTAVDKA